LDRFPALDLCWRSGTPAPALDALHERLHALLDDFAPLAIHDHETWDGWRVFFRTSAQRDGAADLLSASFDPDIVLVLPVDVEDDEWARKSQANLTATKVGRIVVAPPWDVDEELSPDILIIIDPSTGFGTGHHETTRLCLSLLQELDLEGRDVIDVGTGSGVLAIASVLLGARRATAFDEDPEALRNARENVERNGVSASVDVREADLATFDGQPAAVVVANITAAVLERHAGRLTKLVAPGGALVASGFSSPEAADVAAAFALDVEARVSEGDWAAILLRARSNTEHRTSHLEPRTPNQEPTPDTFTPHTQN
jgi:ribosomal protein L11 methyltransferase